MKINSFVLGSAFLALALTHPGAAYAESFEGADAAEASKVVEVEKPAGNTAKVVKKIINVPYINQDKIVSGCEAVSSTMVLRFFGYDISETEFADNYLIRKDWRYSKNGIQGPDPHAAYCGNPYKKSGLNCGFGCYAPAVAKSIAKVLDSKKHKVESVTGTSFADLKDKYIEKDVPVLVWATMGMSQPKKTTTWTVSYVDENSPYKIGEKYTWTAGEHCLVLVGYDEENYYFNDPYKNFGLKAYKKGLVEKRYAELGKQAVVVTKIEETKKA